MVNTKSREESFAKVYKILQIKIQVNSNGWVTIENRCPLFVLERILSLIGNNVIRTAATGNGIYYGASVCTGFRKLVI